MKFLVRSRDTIADIPKDEKHVIISIYCPDDTPAEIQKNEFTVDLLQLAFDDLNARHLIAFPEVAKKHKIFDPFLAKTVVEFVDRHKNIPVVICQCDAGISRSAGMAAALAKYYIKDDSEFFLSRRYAPNTLVYALILDELMMRERAAKGIIFI